MIEFWVILALTILWLYAAMKWAHAELERDEWFMRWLDYKIQVRVTTRKKHTRATGKKPTIRLHNRSLYGSNR